MIPNIPRLLSVLNRDKELFEAMFEKRHRLVSASEVLATVDDQRLAFLIIVNCLLTVMKVLNLMIDY